MVRVILTSRFKFNRSGIVEVVRDTLQKNGITDDVEVSVSVVGERKMRELHKKYMETDEVTDVLSFPTYDRPLLGDIVVCYPVAVKQAWENNRTIDAEMEFLAEHGCKHLLGIHHE